MDEKKVNALLQQLGAQRNAALDQLALASAEVSALTEQVKQLQEENAKLQPVQQDATG